MSRVSLLHPAVIAMGLRVASVRVRRAVRGHRRFEGSAEDVLRAGLEACWTGELLTASPGTYRHFWTRDLGFAAPALMRLGGPWPGRLASSLAWALETWRRRRSHVTTTIDPMFRWPVDIFDYGVDSLPLLLASLRSLTRGADAGVAARAKALASEHADWLAAEVQWFVSQVVDPATGLVRADRTFSAHRDTFKNGSTAYANSMVALLARTVAETGWGPDLLSAHFARPDDSLAFPDSSLEGSSPSAMSVAGIRTEPATAGETGTAGPSATAGPSRAGTARMQMTDIAVDRGGPAPDSRHTNESGDAGHRGTGQPASIGRTLDWGLPLRRHFWTGDRFRDRLGTDETSGEANVWPFFVGLVDDRDMLAAALATLQSDGYMAPYPLKFQVDESAERELWAFRIWSPDYQTTTSWTSLGSIYLSLLSEVDTSAAGVELDRMRALVERDGTLWEVLDRRGRPWRSGSRLSISDASMLWGAILLATLESSRDGGNALRLG
jgi:hypothetical protein